MSEYSVRPGQIYSDRAVLCSNGLPRFFSSRLAFFCVFAGLICGMAPGSNAAPPEPLFLPSITSVSSAETTSRVAPLNWAALLREAGHLNPADRLTLNLFPGLEPIASITRVETPGAGRWVASGFVEGFPASHFTLAADEAQISATVFLPGIGTYRVLPETGQNYRISRIDLTTAGACGNLECAKHAPAPAPVSAMSRPQFGKTSLERSVPPDRESVTNSVALVDVMVVYTAAARAGAGGASGMQTLIDLAVAEANTVYQNSEAQVRLRLVHHSEIEYDEFPNLSTNLTRLQIPDDGFLDGVHALRQTNRADVVCLVTETSDAGFSGLAFTMTALDISFRDVAFSVVKRADLVGTYTFAHEISHNLGCQHDRENALNDDGSAKPGLFPDSAGYRFTTGNVLYRTVMAYAPGQIIPYLSNPNVLFEGAATGVEGTNGMHNVRTINESGALVSGFFGPAVQTRPPAITITPLDFAETFSTTNLLLSAQAEDLDGQIQQVEFYANNRLITIVTNPPPGAITVAWTNVPPDEYRVTARAVDNHGVSTAARPFPLRVRPLNDNFTARLSISGAAPVIDASNRGASLEPGEAVHTGNKGGRSIWYNWVSPHTGTIVLTVTGQNIQPLAEAYQFNGSLLATLGYDREYEETDISVMRTRFDTQAGQEYIVVVDALEGRAGEFTLSLDLVRPPPNDQFSDRQALSGSFIQFSGRNAAATAEPGEPPKHAHNTGGKSIWYSWLAPASGTIVVTATGTNFFPLIDAYLGNSITSITAVTGRGIRFENENNLTQLTFDAVAGTEYALVVDGASGSGGNFEFTLETPAAPPNNHFADRIVLSGTQVTLPVSNVNATRETGEPTHLGQPGGKSIWYSWTAPVSGPVTLVARGTSFFAIPAVYTGTAVDALSAVPVSPTFDPETVTSTGKFASIAFQTYAIAFDGFGGVSGTFEISLTAANRPPSIKLAPRPIIGLVPFGLDVTGSAGQSFSIFGTANLIDWQEIFRGKFVTDSFNFFDEQWLNFPQRYYRVQPVP